VKTYVRSCSGFNIGQYSKGPIYLELGVIWWGLPTIDAKAQGDERAG
jgi:hypothetical protein